MTTSHTPEDRSVNSSLLKAHTPGRLKVPNDGSIGSIESESGVAVGQTFQTRSIRSDDDHKERKANARRLVACWNACEGLPTEDIEQFTPIAVLVSTKVSELMFQRDELLEAVSLAEHTFRHYANLHAAKGPEGADKALRNTELADRMEAAIQKAEGKA